MTKQMRVIVFMLTLCVSQSGCIAANQEPPSTDQYTQEEGTSSIRQDMATSESDEASQEEFLRITVGEYTFDATFEDNRSAEEFKELLAHGPVTVTMRDYGGFEKVGPLGTTLTRSDTQMTTEPGDVILYQGNQITIYYGINSWNLTKLAEIDDPLDLKDKLGTGTVQVTFSLGSGSKPIAELSDT